MKRSPSWAEAEAGRFILFLPVFMAAGVVAYFGCHAEPPAIPAAVMAAICLGAGWFGLRAGWAIAAPALLCAGFAALGFTGAQWEAARAAAWPDLPRRAVVIGGVVAGVDVLPDGRRVTIGAPSVDGGPPIGRALRVRLRRDDAGAVAAGDAIRVRALVRTPAPPSYPDGWDTQRDAYFAGLGGSGFALGPVARVAAAPGGRWQAVREGVAARVLAALPGAAGAIAATLLTGLGSAIPAVDRTAFQASGLSHLLAVAGLHIGIVMGLAYALLRWGLALSEHAALHWPLRRIAACGALLAGLGYLALTGAHVPILRSFAMACLVTLALLTGRRAASMRGLAVAATVLMLAAPDLVMGVSFQMSFAAVLALIAGWEVLSPRLAWLHGPGWWRPPARLVVAGAVTSVLAGAASVPVAAYHFGTATPWTVPANLVAVPLTAFWVMPWGLAALALMPVGLDGAALAPMGWGIQGLLWIAHGVAAWPGALVPVPAMPPLCLALAMLGLAWLCLWRTRLRLAGAVALACAACWPWLAPAPDFYVSGDARLIAARLADGVHVSAAPGVSRFDREVPARLWGVDRARPFPVDGTTDGPVACAPVSCRIELGGRAVVLMQPAGGVHPGGRRGRANQAGGPRADGQPAGAQQGGAQQGGAEPAGADRANGRSGDAACPPGDIVLSHERVYCPLQPIVDRDAAAAQGATTIWLTGHGPVVRTVAGQRGIRPWAVPDMAPAPVRLPAALTE